jgi:hypothetical protein
MYTQLLPETSISTQTYILRKQLKTDPTLYFSKVTADELSTLADPTRQRAEHPVQCVSPAKNAAQQSM